MALRQKTKLKTQSQTIQVQSLETVQMLLHGSLSILSWCRALFPERAFESKRFDLNGSITFEDYTATDARAQLQGPGDAPLNTLVLQRGRSFRVDAFLGWLDDVFASLKRGELESLEVRIHPSLTDRQKVLETYRFSIEYLEDQHGSKTAVGLGMLTPKNGAISVEASQASLRRALLEMTKLAHTLPALPDSRFLTMRLNSWREDSDHQPAKGWVPSTADYPVFLNSSGLDKFTSTMQLNAALHNGLAQLTYIQPSQAGAYGHHSLPGPSSAAHTSQSMLSMEKGPPLNTELEQENTFVEDSFGQDEANVAEPVANQSPETVLQDITSNAVSDGRRRSPRSWSLRQQTELNSSQLTQASNIRPMRRFFEGAQQLEVISQGETQVQTTAGLTRAASVSSETQSGIGDSPTKDGSNELVVGCTQPVLAKSTAIELQRRAASASRNARDLPKVQCVCACAQVDEEMVKQLQRPVLMNLTDQTQIVCTSCKKQQHPHCYGFVSFNDPRIPQSHACYQCLLAGSERNTISQLEGLAPKRRVMHYAFKHGVPKNSEIVENLGLRASIIDPIIADLRKDGFLLNVSGSRKAGYAGLGKPLYVAVRNGSNHERMLRELFDPLVYISHHYDIPIKPIVSRSDISQNLLALQGSLMPPPTIGRTPARTKKRLNSARKKSALHRELSAPAPETPSRPSPLLSKRSHATINEDDDELAQPDFGRPTPEKASKRTKVSVDTEFGLSVNGEVPTSPAGPYPA